MPTTLTTANFKLSAAALQAFVDIRDNPTARTIRGEILPHHDFINRLIRYTVLRILTESIGADELARIVNAHGIKLYDFNFQCPPDLMALVHVAQAVQSLSIANLVNGALILRGTAQERLNLEAAYYEHGGSGNAWLYSDEFLRLWVKSAASPEVVLTARAIRSLEVRYEALISLINTLVGKNLKAQIKPPPLEVPKRADLLRYDRKQLMPLTKSWGIQIGGHYTVEQIRSKLLRRFGYSTQLEENL